MLILIALAVMVLVYVLIRWPLRRMLAMNSRMGQCRDFFSRSLLLILLMLAGALVVGEEFEPPADAAFMQTVWAIGDRLEPVLAMGAIVLGAYVLALIILALGLGRYRDQ